MNEKAYCEFPFFLKSKFTFDTKKKSKIWKNHSIYIENYLKYGVSNNIVYFYK